MKKGDDGKVAKKSWLERSMGAIKKVGNLLPHPFWLFASLALITMVLSAVLHGTNWPASYETVVDGATQIATAQVMNLMTLEALAHYLANFISIFVNYYPLSMLIFMMVTMGCAEKLDLFDALMRKAIIGAPIMIIFIAMSFVGVNSSIGFDAEVMFVMVIAAAVFKSLGLHLWVGIVIGYAATNSGYTVCLMIATTDTTLAGISTQIVEANHIMDATGTLAPIYAAINYYFATAATFIITIVCVVVTRYVTVPHLNRQHPELVLKKDANELEKMKVTSQGARGLKFTG